MTLRRLNRTEYDNTVRDLLGTRLTPAVDFPYDDTGFGFDNIGSVLTISPLHLELYERAADRLVADILRPPLAEPVVLRVEGEEARAEVGGPWRGLAWSLWDAGELSGQVTVPREGRWELAVRAFAVSAGDEPARLELLLDGQVLLTSEITATAHQPATLTVEVEVGEGEHTLAVRFLNALYVPDQALNRQLVIDWLQLRGPLDLPPVEEAPRSRVFVCDPAAVGAEPCAAEILRTLTPRAFRRPVGDDEIERLMALYRLAAGDGLPFDEAVGLALKAVLMSPHFLLRVEPLDRPDDPATQPLDGYAIASRLSYFIWSSAPDQALLDAAARGELDTAAGVRAQAERMMADPRAEALVDNFAGQWLYIRNIDDHTPAGWIYPGFDEALRAAMKQELREAFRRLLREDRPIHDLLVGTDTWLDERLALHYGLPAPAAGAGVVDVADTQRGGLLTQAGLLMVTSAPGRTSPVKRGAWVLTQLLCSAPPPPPPGVEGLVQEEVEAGDKPLREIMEAHRADPTCAGCHNLIDPLGFAMENYDGVGAWRTEDAGWTIDASTTLLDGRSIDGVHALQAALAEDERFTRCVVEKMMTWSLGRGVDTFVEHDTLVALEGRWAQEGYRLSALVALLTTADPFRLAQGEEAAR